MATGRDPRDTAKIRGIVDLFGHGDARLIAHACELRAVVLDQLDQQYPDEGRRADANDLRKLAAQFNTANIARRYIEELE